MQKGRGQEKLSKRVRERLRSRDGGRERKGSLGVGRETERESKRENIVRGKKKKTGTS